MAPTHWYNENIEKLELTPYQLWQLDRYGYYLPEIENEDELPNKISTTEEAYIYLNENPTQFYE